MRLSDEAAKVLARLAPHPSMRELLGWPVSPAARTGYLTHARMRLQRQGVQNLTLELVGAIEELDESNNEMAFLFAAGLPYFKDLAADVLLTSLDIIAFVNEDNVERWLRAILTGDTDDPALMIGSVLWGLIPVLGVLPDIYDLVIRPSVVIKAISLIGIVGGIVELASFIPGLQPVGVGGALGKATSTVMKGLQKAAEFASTAFRGVMRALNLRQAFDLMTEVVQVTLRGISDFPSSLDEIADFVRGLFTGTRHLWDNFVTFVQRVGADLLVRMGFDEGSELIGEIIRRGGQLSDDVLPVVDDVGEGAARAGTKIADEAADGMGTLARNLDSAKLRGTLESIGGACGVASSPGSVAKVAKITAAPVCDPDLLVDILRSADEWDEAVIAGLNKLDRIDGSALGQLLVRFKDSPELLQDSLRLIGRYDFTNWDGVTVGIMTDFIGEHNAVEYTARLMDRMFETGVTDEFSEQFGRILKRLDGDEALRTLAGSETENVRNGIITLLRRADHPNTPDVFKGGWEFQLERAKEYAERLTAVELKQSAGNGNIYVDLVLDNDIFVEVKYWQKSTLARNAQDVVDQVVARSEEASKVIIEFGRKTQDPISNLDDPVIQNLIRQLRPLSVGFDPSADADVIILLIP
ncbi:MAG: hypothetical protein ACLFWD_02785 [Anaerolineales bacterium]